MVMGSDFVGTTHLTANFKQDSMTVVCYREEKLDPTVILHATESYPAFVLMRVFIDL